MKPKVVTLIVGVLAIAAGPSSDLWGQIRYTVTDLGTLSDWDSSWAYGINNNGKVVGWSQGYNGVGAAFTFGDGTMQTLGTLPTLNLLSIAYGVNDSGQVAGASFDGHSTKRAFLYSNGTMQDLGTLPGGGNSVAYDINNNGQVVGNALNSIGHEVAFLYSNGSMQELLPNIDYSTAQAINEKGQVTGYLSTMDGGTHSFLCAGGTNQDLGTLPGYTRDLEAYAISEAGQVVGGAYSDDGKRHEAFIYANGSMEALGSFGEHNSFAYGINDKGQVVGVAGEYPNYAFLYSDGATYNLNDLIADRSGWSLSTALAINDSGEIVGFGDNPNHKHHGFLLTPVPEPSMLALVGATVVGLLVGALRLRRATWRALTVKTVKHAMRMTITAEPARWFTVRRDDEQISGAVDDAGGNGQGVALRLQRRYLQRSH